MINISEKYCKLTTLLIMLCLCFVFTGCKKNVQSSQDGWTCTCGTVNTSNFCGNCGSAKPVWTCSCGTENTTNFCGNCGKQKGEQQEQKQATNSNPFINAKVGDYVKFGNYPQTATGAEKPIEWQVLAKEDNKMLVISRYGLDAKRFDDDSNVWANSEIRKCLNVFFYNNAFNGREKKLINSSNLSDVGTTDNVFLLSKEEAEKYFANDDSRRCKATDYAVKNGAYVADSSLENGAGYSCWLLRSPDDSYISFVYIDGSFNYGGYDDRRAVVRPALWINLDVEQENLDLKVDSSSQVLNNQIEKQNLVNSNPFKNAKVGDYVKFGNYPQTAEGEEQPIEWQVLAKENNKLLVISRYGLDAMRFDDDSNDWENSEIRQWLNGDFYNKVFNGNEKKLINPSNLFDVSTTDNVFLLSKEEAENYFANDVPRRCKATEYAVKRGAFVYDGSLGGEAGYGFWWLRSPDLKLGCNRTVYFVIIVGDVDFSVVSDDNILVRPALWINL